MPAHDTPYFDPAGGRNAAATSVVTAVGLGAIAGDGLAGGLPLRLACENAALSSDIAPDVRALATNVTILEGRHWTVPGALSNSRGPRLTSGSSRTGTAQRKPMADRRTYASFPCPTGPTGRTRSGRQPDRPAPYRPA